MNALQWVWDKLDGKKTYLGAAIMAVVGLDSVFHFFSPDVHAALMTIAGSIGTVGIAHKLEKSTNGK